MTEERIKQLQEELQLMLMDLFERYPEPEIEIKVDGLANLMAYRHAKEYDEGELNAFLEYQGYPHIPNEGFVFKRAHIIKD